MFSLLKEYKTVVERLFDIKQKLKVSKIKIKFHLGNIYEF